MEVTNSSNATETQSRVGGLQRYVVVSLLKCGMQSFKAGKRPSSHEWALEDFPGVIWIFFVVLVVVCSNSNKT